MFKIDPNQPLGLPEGSVRGLLVLMIVGAFLWLCITTGKVPATLETITEWALGGYGILRGATALLKTNVVPSSPPVPPVPPADPNVALN